jgi:hypothetical protein
LTFDGDHGEGSEPLGLAFAELPGLQRGIAYERYKPYNSWTKPIRFHHTAELPDWMCNSCSGNTMTPVGGGDSALRRRLSHHAGQGAGRFGHPFRELCGGDS